MSKWDKKDINKLIYFYILYCLNNSFYANLIVMFSTNINIIPIFLLKSRAAYK